MSTETEQVVAGALCYHRDRHAYQEYGMVSPWIIMVCRDCGAKVSAGFNTQLPDMPPMPYPPEDQQVEEKQCEPTNEQLEAAKAVLLPSLIRDPERGSLSSCVTLIRLALRASLSVGGSITPHPEARETDTGFSVTSEEYLAQIDAAVARGDAPAYMAEMLRKALAAGGSPTTIPDDGFIDPGVEGAP